MKRLVKMLRAERRSLERARRRFVRKPDSERLHDVRTSARRLRSLLEDLAGCMPSRKLLRRVKRTAAATDAARDAAVLAHLLDSSVPTGEREIAQPLLEHFRRQERQTTKRARRQLRRTSF